MLKKPIKPTLRGKEKGKGKRRNKKEAQGMAVEMLFL